MGTSPQQIIQDAIEQGAFPGATWAFGTKDFIETGSAGRYTQEAESREVTADTIYDLASVSKVVATTSVAMLLSQMEELDIELPVSHYLPSFPGDATVLNLLLHNSGLPPHVELWKLYEDRAAAWKGLPLTPLAYETGAETQYSCIGFIVLSMILEKLMNGGNDPTDMLKEFEVFAELSIFTRLSMGHTTFRPGPFTRRSIPPTEVNERGEVQGVVHDENAWFLGGVAGNAGLFSSAPDLAKFAQCLLKGGDGIFREDFIRVWTRRESESSTRALGWDTKSEIGSSAGSEFGKHSFGHLGFTGTSLWIDPEEGIFAALLSNRTYPSRENQLITEVRPAFHDAVAQIIRA